MYPRASGVFSYKSFQKPIDRKTKICYNQDKEIGEHPISYKLGES